MSELDDKFVDTLSRLHMVSENVSYALNNIKTLLVEVEALHELALDVEKSLDNAPSVSHTEFEDRDILPAEVARLLLKMCDGLYSGNLNLMPSEVMDLPTAKQWIEEHSCPV